MIEIESETIRNYIKFKLDKIEDKFTEEELSGIDELFINDEEEAFDLRTINLFNGLKRIELLNFFITSEDINILLSLSNLSDITFDRCNFEDADEIKKLNLTSLSLINCNLNNYDFIYEMNQLNSLSITNSKVNIDKINSLTNLEYLQLSYCILEENNIINLSNLKELYIDNTNIFDLNFVKNLPKLEVLSISESQYFDNKELIKDLIKNNISILNESIVEFDGEEYE